MDDLESRSDGKTRKEQCIPGYLVLNIRGPLLVYTAVFSFRSFELPTKLWSFSSFSFSEYTMNTPAIFFLESNDT